MRGTLSRAGERVKRIWGFSSAPPSPGLPHRARARAHEARPTRGKAALPGGLLVSLANSPGTGLESPPFPSGGVDDAATLHEERSVRKSAARVKALTKKLRVAKSIDSSAGGHAAGESAPARDEARQGGHSRRAFLGQLAGTAAVLAASDA